MWPGDLYFTALLLCIVMQSGKFGVLCHPRQWEKKNSLNSSLRATSVTGCFSLLANLFLGVLNHLILLFSHLEKRGFKMEGFTENVIVCSAYDGHVADSCI